LVIIGQKASERCILLVLSGLVVLILGAVWVMMPRIRPGSEIDAVATILFAFLAYAILLFAVMVRKGKLGSTAPCDASCPGERESS